MLACKHGRIKVLWYVLIWIPNPKLILALSLIFVVQKAPIRIHRAISISATAKNSGKKRMDA